MTEPGTEGHDAKHPVIAGTHPLQNKPMTAAGTSEARSQYLSFFLAGEEYGLAILRVTEILEDHGPARDASMPIIDLVQHFGLRSSAAMGRGCVVVVVEVLLDGEPTVIGLVTTAVGGVLELALEAIEPPPSFGTAVPADYLDGIARTGRRFVRLVNIERVLAEQGQPLHRLESERSVTTSVEDASG
jgi:purine-binding chemotaxis protein CheW